jgi:hypothetical protein
LSVNKILTNIKRNKNTGCYFAIELVVIKWVQKHYEQMSISSFFLPYRKADDTPSPLLSTARSKLQQLRH